VFTNFVDGYSMKVPAGLSVNMNYSSVGAFLESEDLKIEVYKQYVGNIGQAAYYNYTDQFTNNRVDHFVEAVINQEIGGKDVRIVSWHRSKLSKVANDKNYYLSIYIPSGAYVFSIFIKSNDVISNSLSYTDLVNSFYEVPVTRSGYTKMTAQVDVESKNWNDETRYAYEQSFLYSNELSWGLYDYNFLGYLAPTLEDIEKKLSYNFSSVLYYTSDKTTSGNISNMLKYCKENDKLLEITFQPRPTADGGNSLYDILNGEMDELLYNYAKLIADSGYPVLFRLFNEMNGDWCSYCAYNYGKDTDLYKIAYQYVYHIFEDAKVDNAIWVWNPNGESKPEFKWNDELMYYPGDKYVDVVGMTLYNTGTYYSSVGERWKSFSSLYNPLYSKYVGRYNQPLMITEFGCAAMGGDKAAWFSDMAYTLKNMPKIKMAIYWNGYDYDSSSGQKVVARYYALSDSEASFNAFKKAIKKSWRQGSIA